CSPWHGTFLTRFRLFSAFGCLLLPFSCLFLPFLAFCTALVWTLFFIAALKYAMVLWSPWHDTFLTRFRLFSAFGCLWLPFSCLFLPFAQHWFGPCSSKQRSSTSWCVVPMARHVSNSFPTVLC